MDAREIRELTETLARVVEAARNDPETARQARDAVVESGLLDVFSVNGALDVLDLLDAGGEDALRARLKGLPLARLREIIAAQNFDPAKETAKWRGAAKLSDFIIQRASQRLAEEQEASASQPNALVASWML